MNLNTDGEKLCGSLKELTLQKQLPRRQQTKKPVLRYDPPIAKSVNLLNQIVNSSCRHDRRGSATPTTGILPKGSVSHPSSPALPRHKNINSDLSLPDGSRQGVSNLYNRPVSAKDITNNAHHSHRYVEGGSSSSNHSLSSVSSTLLQNTNGNHHTAQSETHPGVPLQLNSFMRSQSGVKRDKKSNIHAPDRKSGSQALASGAAGKTASTLKQQCKEEENHSANFGVASQERAPTSIPGSKISVANDTNLGSKIGNLNTLNAAQTKISAVRNPNYTPNKPYSEVSEPVLKGPDKNATNGARENWHVREAASVNDGTAFKQAFSDVSLGKPLMGENQKEAGHISLSKPPLQLSNGAFILMNSGQGVAKVTGVGVNKLDPLILPTGIDSNLVNMSNQQDGNVHLHNLIGTLRKMPVTNTMTGTLYYQKSFRDARREVEASKVIVPEQRPVGDGAPAQFWANVRDKSGSGAEIEEEDDNDSTISGERMPGDGEASIDGLDNEDDGLDNMDDDCVGGSDDELDSCTVSSLSQQSLTSIKSASSVSCGTSVVHSAHSKTAHERNVRGSARPKSASGNLVLLPALQKSLFPDTPPTINFVGEGEKVEQLPWEIRKLMKWRMSPITPNIIKTAIARIGFRISKKNHDWLGCFGKHMKAQCFKSIREYQKLNHFPGSFQIGRKDRLWINLSRLQMSFGKKEYGFVPQTFVLPKDLKLLKRAWEDGGSRLKWIIKPPASARGIGIKVIHKWSQIPRRRPVVVQKYLSRPLLINDSKFDMRVYVYVSSYDPLRAYVFEDGLARFASCKYSSSMKNLSNKFMHLTNYSVNKHNAEYQSNSDNNVCQGHKWSLKALWAHLKKDGVDTNAIWENIKDIVIKTLISAESSISSMVKSSVRSRYVVHELFGFDILLDDQLRPWILEVNISPSLHSNSQLDISVKGQMICDMMNIAGFRIPDKRDVSHPSSSQTDFSSHIPLNDYCMDKRLFTQQLAPDERTKHAYFCHRHLDKQVQQTILDVLTPDDIRILCESVDEDSRKGGFIRVFPTPNSHKYLRFFEQPRYYNLLLDQWVKRYNHMELIGITLLQSHCEQGLHLENPTDNSKHQWCPPNASSVLTSQDTKQPKDKDGGSSGGPLKSSQSMSQLPRVHASLSSSLPGSASSSSLSSMQLPKPSPKIIAPQDPNR